MYDINWLTVGLVLDGQSATKADVRQWLIAHRDDLMARYGCEAYLDALERWNRNADIQKARQAHRA